MKNHLSYIFILSLVIFCSCGSSSTENTGTEVHQKDTIRTDDPFPMHYKTFGSGKPLLIINGGPGMNSAGFEDLAKQLSKNNQTIIYDQRGTGKSKLEILDSTTITMDLMVEDLESLRKHLKIEKWIVFGHSFGGMLASYYATRYPERIEKLILSSSGGIDLELLGSIGDLLQSKLTRTQKDSIAYWDEKIAAGDTSHATALQRGRILAHAYVIKQKYIPVIGERLTQGNSTINQLVWDDLLRIKFNCGEKLKSFKKPVLIIQGEEDIVSKSLAKKAYQTFPDSRIVFLVHSIHYGWLDAPETFFSEVKSFLSE